MMRSGRILLLVICTASFGAPASALLIDNFSEPDDFSVSAGNSSVSSNNTFLDPADTLGGVRSWSLVANAQGETATFSIPAGGGTAALTAETSGGVLWFGYGRDPGGNPTIPLPFDLTASGTLNRFEVDVGAASATGTLEVLVRQITGGQVFTASLPVSASGLLSIPYSSFSGSPDFTDISYISLELALGNAGAVELTEFRAVPEPSVASLMAVGFLSLAAWRAAARRSG